MKLVPRAVLRIVVLSSLGAALGLVAPSAQACGGDWEAPPVDPFPVGVARAEKELQQGKTLAAAATVVRMYPQIRALSPKNGSNVARALRILAVATARGDGALAFGDEVPGSLREAWSSTAEQDRQARLTWAAGTLRVLSEKKKDDPVIQAELGEALARLEGSRTEATKMLADLAERDLLGSPEAYATLARLREQGGDVAGRDAARKRCEGMAKDPRVCAPSDRSS